MKEDLKIFTQLVDEILKEDIYNPAPTPIPSEALLDPLDLWDF